MTDPLVAVHLQKLPVSLWAQSQEHSDELLREFLLIASERNRPHLSHEIPGRLTALIDELTGRYGEFSAENAQRLADAAAAGVDSIDLDYLLPVSAATAADHLCELLDEADDYCRTGQHLLTLATPDRLVQFRRWFLGEISWQVAGRPPIPWPDYQG